MFYGEVDYICFYIKAMEVDKLSQNLVVFKGKKEGISIYIKDGDFDSIKNEIEKKIKKSEKFFIGAKVIEISGIEGKEISNKEREEVEKILCDKYNMLIEGSTKKVKEKPVIATKAERVDEGYFEGIYEGNTKFIHSTIRSGQSVKFDGNIVIVGDVNPGGEIIANGNIVVLGSLRGVAYAGNNGNEQAIVAAFNLIPTQLRIADILSRKPDEEFETPKGPEVARIYKKSIIIESYLTRK